MKRSILLAVLCVLRLQVSADNDLLDSLWRSYESQPKGVDRSLTLNEIIWELSSSDADSSMSVSKLMLRDALEYKDDLMIALAYRNMGLAFLRLRNNDPALEHLENALKYYRLKNDSAFYRGAGATLSSMGAAYKNAGHMPEAMDHYHQSIAMHRLANDPAGIVYCYNGMGRIWEIQGRADSALTYYGLTAQLAAELEMDLMEAGGYGNLANVHGDMGNTGEAIDLAYRSLAIMERIDHKPGIAACLTTISSLKDALGEKESSLRELERAYALYQEADYRQGLMTAGSSIGALLMQLDRPDSAMMMLESSLELMRQADARDLMGLTLQRLGKLYREKGDLVRSRVIIEEALQLSTEIEDVRGRSIALALLGRTAFSGGHVHEAISNCTKALDLAGEIEAPEEIVNSCECLYMAHKASGNATKALQFHERFIAVRDELVNAGSQKKLIQRDLMYTFDKRQLADSLQFAAELVQIEGQRTIEKLRADQNSNRAMATGIGALLLLGGGGSYFLADRRRRKERFEKEAATLETQALRSQMNPHFIFNALNSINAFVQRNDQDRASTFLSKFARVMRSVLENSRHAEVPLNDDLETLRGYLELERMRMENKFDFTITVDPSVNAEEVFVPPLVVQPFVENAIWHGMAGMHEKGLITLHVQRRNEQLVWTIEDNGVGRNVKKSGSSISEKKTSLGTAITRSRLDLVRKQHGGKAGFEYTDMEQGTRVEVEMPWLLN